MSLFSMICSGSCGSPALTIPYEDLGAVEAGGEPPRFT
jgi:hypothetical protein